MSLASTAQYRAGSYSGALRQQVLRVAMNPEAQRYMGNSVYRERRYAADSKMPHFPDNIMVGAWQGQDKTVALCIQGPTRLTAPMSIHRARALLDVTHETFMYYQHELSARWYVGAEHEGRWHFVQCGCVGDSEILHGEPLHLQSAARTFADRSENILVLQHGVAVDINRKSAQRRYASITAGVLQPLSISTANTHFGNANIYEWDTRHTIDALFVGNSRKHYRNSVTMMQAIGAASITGAISQTSLAIQWGVAAATGYFGVQLIRAAQRAHAMARNTLYDRNALSIDRQVWDVMQANPRVRAEPLIIESALEAVPELNHARALRSLVRMVDAGYIDRRLWQVIADDGQVFDVPHYDLVHPPADGDHSKREKHDIFGIVDPALQT